jgi:hypothetical protein
VLRLRLLQRIFFFLHFIPTFPFLGYLYLPWNLKSEVTPFSHHRESTVISALYLWELRVNLSDPEPSVERPAKNITLQAQGRKRSPMGNTRVQWGGMKVYAEWETHWALSAMTVMKDPCSPKFVLNQSLAVGVMHNLGLWAFLKTHF